MKDDILLKLYVYCKEKYGKKLQEFIGKFAEEFPYHIEGMDTSDFIRSFMDWFVLEKIMPDTVFSKTMTMNSPGGGTIILQNPLLACLGCMD